MECIFDTVLYIINYGFIYLIRIGSNINKLQFTIKIKLFYQLIKDKICKFFNYIKTIDQNNISYINNCFKNIPKFIKERLILFNNKSNKGYNYLDKNNLGFTDNDMKINV